MSEPFWTKQPSVLWNVTGKNALWPFAAKQTRAARYNALTRWAIIASALIVLLTRNPWNIIWGVLAIAGFALAEQSTPNTTTSGSKALPVRTPHALPGSTVLQRPEAFEFVPTSVNPNPGLLDGVANPGSDEALQNPYRNPLPYDPGVAVRSRRSVYRPKEEPWIDNLYRGSGELSMDLFANPLPDQTLMARRIYWDYAPQPDIVSSEARTADRWMTY